MIFRCKVVSGWTDTTTPSIFEIPLKLLQFSLYLINITIKGFKSPVIHRQFYRPIEKCFKTKFEIPATVHFDIRLQLLQIFLNVFFGNGISNLHEHGRKKWSIKELIITIRSTWTTFELTSSNLKSLNFVEIGLKESNLGKMTNKRKNRLISSIILIADF